jgi:hypothetical protein
MSTFQSSSKSNRLLQSRRYTIAGTDAAEAFTNVLDLNATEIYTQQAFIPTSSAGLLYSSSAGDGLTIDSGSTPILRYYYRLRMTPTNVAVGGNYPVWFAVSGSDGSAVSPQVVQERQKTQIQVK